MAETGSAALDFNKKISILFKNDPTKVLGIQKCLSDYNENNILFSLVETLRSFISSPNELLLFDYVRMLVDINLSLFYLKKFQKVRLFSFCLSLFCLMLVFQIILKYCFSWILLGLTLLNEERKLLIGQIFYKMNQRIPSFLK